MMIDLKAIQAICSWCIGITDKTLWPWLRQNFTLIRALSHVYDARRLGRRSHGGKAEFFGGGNLGWSVGRQIRTAGEECGLYSIVVADNHHWNGRKNDARGEPTATGMGIPYHGTPPTEGGFARWLDSFLLWPEEILRWVIAVEWTNETKPTPASSAWIVQFMRRNAHRVTAEGWLNVVDQFQARSLQDAGLGDTFQVVAPHIFNLEPAGARAFIAALRAEFPDKLTWVSEVLDPHSSHTYEMGLALIEGGASGISAFSGTTQQPEFYHDDLFRWNGREGKPAASCWTDSGLTKRGEQWERLIRELGIGGGQPVEPPVDPLPTVNVDAAVRKIERQVFAGKKNWGRLTMIDGFKPTKTVANILDDLGQPWEAK